jgi:hypothetical protein
MDDRFPSERGVGYGVPFADTNLAAACPRCKAPVGEKCIRRGGGSHTPRVDRASRLFLRESYKLFHKLEKEALRRNPRGPLWWFAGSIAHECGVVGAHCLADCALPVEEPLA